MVLSLQSSRTNAFGGSYDFNQPEIKGDVAAGKLIFISWKSKAVRTEGVADNKTGARKDGTAKQPTCREVICGLLPLLAEALSRLPIGPKHPVW
jgi:hypothetical protein